jgi:hypothetical protein
VWLANPIPASVDLPTASSASNPTTISISPTSAFEEKKKHNKMRRSTESALGDSSEKPKSNNSDKNKASDKTDKSDKPNEKVESDTVFLPLFPYSQTEFFLRRSSFSS